jgi:hypothetical protein
MESQDRLLALINEDQLIERLNVGSESSIDQILDARDAPEFVVLWMKAYASIESRKREIDDVQSDLSTQIRKVAYLRAYARWKSPDLAAYISDDFGLFADAAALCVDEPWIEEMLRKYKSGEVPATP